MGDRQPRKSAWSANDGVRGSPGIEDSRPPQGSGAGVGVFEIWYHHVRFRKRPLDFLKVCNSMTIFFDSSRLEFSPLLTSDHESIRVQLQYHPPHVPCQWVPATVQVCRFPGLESSLSQSRVRRKSVACLLPPLTFHLQGHTTNSTEIRTTCNLRNAYL